jgi:hypothetical protein
LAALLKALGQQGGKSCKPSHRIAQVDLVAGEPIELGWLAGFPSALAGCEISEGDKTFEMSVSYRSVHSDGFGDTVHRPFGLVYIEVEQDPSAGLILKRADRAVELLYFVLSHIPELTVSYQREGADDRTSSRTILDSVSAPRSRSRGAWLAQ